MCGAFRILWLLDFTLRSFQAYRPVFQQECAGLAADSTATAESLDLAARDLAKKQFECLLSETKHDQQVFEIYLQNRANHTVNVQGIAVQYQKKLSDEARAAVEKWWDKHVLGPV